jgi:hypothetical protein
LLPQLACTHIAVTNPNHFPAGDAGDNNGHMTRIAQKNKRELEVFALGLNSMWD